MYLSNHLNLNLVQNNISSYSVKKDTIIIFFCALIVVLSCSCNKGRVSKSYLKMKNGTIKINYTFFSYKQNTLTFDEKNLTILSCQCHRHLFSFHRNVNVHLHIMVPYDFCSYKTRSVQNLML